MAGFQFPSHQRKVLHLPLLLEDAADAIFHQKVSVVRQNDKVRKFLKSFVFLS